MKRYVGGGNETPLWEAPSWTNAGVMTSPLGGDIWKCNRLKTNRPIHSIYYTQLTRKLYVIHEHTVTETKTTNQTNLTYSLTPIAVLWMYAIKEINRWHGCKATLTLSCDNGDIFHFHLLGFEVTGVSNTTSAHHSTACIETRARWSAKQLLWVPSKIPSGFTFPLKSDKHIMRPRVRPHCVESLRSKSLEAMWGFGWLVSALEGS